MNRAHRARQGTLRGGRRRSCPAPDRRAAIATTARRCAAACAAPSQPLQPGLETLHQAPDRPQRARQRAAPFSAQLVEALAAAATLGGRLAVTGGDEAA